MPRATLTALVREFLAERGPSTVAGMRAASTRLRAFTPDQVHVAASACVNAGTACLIGQTPSPYGGHPRNVYGPSNPSTKPRAAPGSRVTRETLLAALRRLNNRATARAIAAELKTAEPHDVRCVLAELKKTGRVVAVGAELANGRPEILWSIP